MESRTGEVRIAEVRAGCEWKSVIGYSRFDDIKDLAIGNRYAVLMGKPFELLAEIGVRLGARPAIAS
jgi:hypothetical protein